jgi:hypothetical protein
MEEDSTDTHERAWLNEWWGWGSKPTATKVKANSKVTYNNSEEEK